MKICDLCAKEIPEEEACISLTSTTFFGRKDHRHPECYIEFVKDNKKFLKEKVTTLINNIEGLEPSGIIYVIDLCSLHHEVDRCPECKQYYKCINLFDQMIIQGGSRK